MKLRYQMRGLGVGIVVTALLMGVAVGDGIPLSDAEIRAKAMELGMVDANTLTLADVGNATSEPVSTNSPTPEPISTPTPAAQATEPPASEPDTDMTVTFSPGPGTVSAEEPAETVQPGQESQTVTLVIESGERSYDICQRLEEAGLIESAASFDTYLCDIGYSRTIKDGIYKIPIGTSEEEIAKIITKTQ